MCLAPLRYLGGTRVDAAAAAVLFVINGSNFVKQGIVLYPDGGQKSYGQTHASFGWGN